MHQLINTVNYGNQKIPLVEATDDKQLKVLEIHLREHIWFKADKISHFSPPKNWIKRFLEEWTKKFTNLLLIYLSTSQSMQVKMLEACLC